MKIRTILIDDEPLARTITREYLQGYPQIEILTECNDGFEGVKAITQHKPDLIFLDIQMPKINGFEMLELLDPPPPVIFTTAFDEYAIKAFEAHAIDYLLKPYSKERFDKAMQKWFERHQQDDPPAVKGLVEEVRQPEERTRIVVRESGNIRIIPVRDVHYLEAYDDYVKIYTGREMFLKKKTMSFYENSLEANEFIRVHRSYIVQLSQITRIEPLEKDTHVALLKSGTRIPLSKSGYARLRKVLDL
jgi:two-component system, LytTR family, response regulator